MTVKNIVIRINVILLNITIIYLNKKPQGIIILTHTESFWSPSKAGEGTQWLRILPALAGDPSSSTQICPYVTHFWRASQPLLDSTGTHTYIFEVKSWSTEPQIELFEVKLSHQAAVVWIGRALMGSCFSRLLVLFGGGGGGVCGTFRSLSFTGGSGGFMLMLESRFNESSQSPALLSCLPCPVSPTGTHQVSLEL